MTASNKAQKQNSTKTVKLDDAARAKGWSEKHPKCGTCGLTERKRYSGSSCTKCYTEARNERLGIGKDSPEARAKRAQRLEDKILTLEAQLKMAKAELKELKS